MLHVVLLASLSPSILAKRKLWFLLFPVAVGSNTQHCGWQRLLQGAHSSRFLCFYVIAKDAYGSAEALLDLVYEPK